MEQETDKNVQLLLRVGGRMSIPTMISILTAAQESHGNGIVEVDQMGARIVTYPKKGTINE